MEAQHKLAPAHLGEMWTQSDDGNGLLARTGFVPGSGLGVKIATVFPSNVSLPSVHTVYVLFDPDDGQEQAVIASNALTWFKTACDSGLGSRQLSREDSGHLVMVGAGAMAPHGIRAHRAARPSIERVTIWNRTRHRAEALAATLVGDITVTDDLQTAIESADIVSCATMTVQPLIKGEWLRPGTHVDAMGALKPNMREVDDEVLRRARVFVDSRDSTFEHIGELKIPLAAARSPRMTSSPIITSSPPASWKAAPAPTTSPSSRTAAAATSTSWLPSFCSHDSSSRQCANREDTEPVASRTKDSSSASSRSPGKRHAGP